MSRKHLWRKVRSKRLNRPCIVSQQNVHFRQSATPFVLCSPGGDLFPQINSIFPLPSTGCTYQQRKKSAPSQRVMVCHLFAKKKKHFLRNGVYFLCSAFLLFYYYDSLPLLLLLFTTNFLLLLLQYECKKQKSLNENAYSVIDVY